VNKLIQILTEYSLTTSAHKTKSMAFKGVRSKIVIGNTIIEQVNSFNYLGYLMSYENEMDLITNYITI
jgi:hypothetical protein